MVVDDAVAVIINQNPMRSTFTTNRQFGVVTNRPDAVEAAAIFAIDRNIQGRKPREPAGGPHPRRVASGA
jgi:hypothetical protein